MNGQELLKSIVQKEMSFGCYDARIDDVSIYSFLRYHIRKEILMKSGTATLEPRQKVNKSAVLWSLLDSLKHFIVLKFSRRHYSTVLYSFSRVDKIGDQYLDKFTDPLIENVEFKDDYIIFDHGRAGMHAKPRLHSNKVIYLDAISVYSSVLSSLFWKKYYIRNKECFDEFMSTVEKAFGLELSSQWLVKLFYSNYLYSQGLRRLFCLISAKRVIGPARAYMEGPFYAAKCLGMKRFELQHGITYGETQMYSGYRDEMIMPDYFLAFGDNKPKDVYGIDESRIVNIGWALQDYIANLPQKEHYEENDVLVISDPEITDAIFDVVQKLAEGNPSSCFYIRPHPHEVLEERHMKIIDSMPNVKLQDKKINITVVLQGFSHIVGENSTVLYEALAIHKKVGKLSYPGLHPKYLEESDKDCFWEISSQQDFVTFLKEDVSSKKSKCIYSPFNKELFEKVIGLQ